MIKVGTRVRVVRDVHGGLGPKPGNEGVVVAVFKHFHVSGDAYDVKLDEGLDCSGGPWYLYSSEIEEVPNAEA